LADCHKLINSITRHHHPH